MLLNKELLHLFPFYIIIVADIFL